MWTDRKDDVQGMISDEERREIEALKARFLRPQAAAIEAMKALVDRHGWLPDEDLAELAGLLSMSVEELDSVATFYNQIYRRKTGRHVILVCDSFACWVMGYDDLMDHLKARLGVDLGGTTPDGRFTLLPISCLGACDQAPAMLVDGELYGRLTAERIDEILERHP
jgi:NADH-quinone oxidoreductase subunit E